MAHEHNARTPAQDIFMEIIFFQLFSLISCIVWNLNLTSERKKRWDNRQGKHTVSSKVQKLPSTQIISWAPFDKRASRRKSHLKENKLY